MSTMRQASQRDWTGSNINAINAGSLQRIADASELMARNHKHLVSQLDYWRDEACRRQEVAARLYRSNAALRGVITRMKRQAKDE